MDAARRWTLVELVVIGALAFGGAWRERMHQSVEMQYLSFLALLAGPSLRRLGALTTTLSPPPRIAFLFELTAFSALVTYPIGVWAHLLAGVAALTVALPPLRTEGPVTTAIAGRIVFAAMILVTFLAIATGWDARDRRSMWAVWPFVILSLEALLPPHGLRETLRRTAGLSVVLAPAALHSHMGYRSQETECLLLVFSTVIAAFAFMEILGRLKAGRDEDERRAWRRRVRFGAVACAIPIGFLWAGAEIFCATRPTTATPVVAPIVDDGTQPFHAPGKRYVFAAPKRIAEAPEDLVQNEFVWNRDGFHDQDHELAKPRGTLRIALLGDSFVEGIQLRLEDLLHRRLESLLATKTPRPLEVETLAFGWSGWGQANELAALRAHAMSYAPDLVLLEFLPTNDVANNHPELEVDRMLSWPRLFSVVAGQRGLRFTALLADRIDHVLARVAGRSANVDEEVFAKRLSAPRAAAWEEAWGKTHSLVSEIATVTSQHGARLVVVIYPSAPEVRALAEQQATTNAFDFEGPARRMREACARAGIPCLDLGPRFARLDSNDRSHLFLNGDGHWSSFGHARAAEEVARFLLGETAIWSDLVAKAPR